MLAVHESLMVGGLGCCRSGDASVAVVHACKTPCHQRAVGYTNTLDRDHPSYLAHPGKFELYLNLIDPKVPLFQVASFVAFFRFIDEQIADGRRVLIHCNQGESRAPSLALLVLAKRLGTVPDESYAAARAAFEAKYERYRPGEGIATFLSESWGSLGQR